LRLPPFRRIEPNASALSLLAPVPLAPLGISSLLHLFAVPGGLPRELRPRWLIVYTFNRSRQCITKFASLLDGHGVRLS
jgi:hypothetical protein